MNFPVFSTVYTPVRIACPDTVYQKLQAPSRISIRRRPRGCAQDLSLPTGRGGALVGIRHGLPLRDERFCKIMKRSRVQGSQAVSCRDSYVMRTCGIRGKPSKSKKSFQNTLIFNVICGKILPYRKGTSEQSACGGEIFRQSEQSSRA